MSQTAELKINGHCYEIPVITGTENEKALDIRKLRAETNLITLDPGYVNTGSCSSAITFLNGEEGILRYRGIPIEQLAENSTFVEVAYLLIYGDLPRANELMKFRQTLSRHSVVSLREIALDRLHSSASI